MDVIVIVVGLSLLIGLSMGFGLGMFVMALLGSPERDAALTEPHAFGHPVSAWLR